MENNYKSKINNPWFNKLVLKIQKLFSSSDKKNEDENKETKTESEQEKEIREGKEEFKKYFEDFKSQTSLNVEADKLTNAINNFQYYETRIFESNGYDDGTKGTRERNIESSASARAAFIYEHACSILSGRIAGLENETSYLNKQITDKELQIITEAQFNSEITFLDKKEHRNFSNPLAVFYIIVGISIMFADFPISLGISKYFIDLPIDFEDTFFSKIKNPEVLLFSLGITFLSVYFKILYDEYINKSIISDKFIKENNEKENKNVDIASILRLTFKFSVLFLLVYLLYNIGNVRNSLSDLPIKSKYPDMVNNNEIFNYKLISFIGTTILLPLLSGICLSVGFSILSNVSNLKNSNKSLKHLNERKHDFEVEKKDAETIKYMLETLKQEWDKKSEKIEHLKKLFANAYNQGFKRGHRIKFGIDLYENANSIFIDSINDN